MAKPIAIASDHAGVSYKENVGKYLQELGYTVTDYGAHSAESVDYPDYAHKAAEAVATGGSDRAIIVCGSGIGVSIVANKSRGVRAANCVTPEMAELAREHNDANVLTIGERLVEWDSAKEIIQRFLQTPSSDNDRHQRRVRKIHDLTGC